MWETIKTDIRSSEIIHYQIGLDEKALKHSEVIENWITHPAFRKYYNGILKECPFEAFYWEHPPLTVDDLDKPYEFALINSHSLNRVLPEPRAFAQYFRNNDPVVSFPNLSGDARLIVPAPIIAHDNYTHIGKFVRNAPESQIDAFWLKAGETYKAAIGSQKRWFSTAGNGVYWLHLRIDSRPKYYKYAPYRNQ